MANFPGGGCVGANIGSIYRGENQVRKNIGTTSERTLCIHTLNISSYFPGYGCVSLGTVVHEMLHATGFWHEQSRPDRDDHVRIIWQNIVAGMEDNFARYSRAEVSTLSLPYDTASVMHYSSKAFSSNGQLTISPIK